MHAGAGPFDNMATTFSILCIAGIQSLHAMHVHINASFIHVRDFNRTPEDIMTAEQMLACFDKLHCNSNAALVCFMEWYLLQSRKAQLRG